MIVNIPARLLTPVLPALNRVHVQAFLDGAQQDATALKELASLLRAALDAQPCSVAELAVRESESVPPSDCCPVTGQEYGTGA